MGGQKNEYYEQQQNCFAGVCTTQKSSSIGGKSGTTTLAAPKATAFGSGSFSFGGQAGGSSSKTLPKPPLNFSTSSFSIPAKLGSSTSVSGVSSTGSGLFSFGAASEPTKNDSVRLRTMNAINAICKARGGVYSEYSCKVVSWDDSSRFQIGSSPFGLSAFGSNITDTVLKERNNTKLFTLRSDNWNEKLGRVSSNSVALVATVPGSTDLAPVTLRDFLKKCGNYASYTGLKTDKDLSSDDLDLECSIRFQTTFLPVQSGTPGSLEFTPESFNYQTYRSGDPKNLLLLCTTQGVALQQDGPGSQRLFHHKVHPVTGVVSRHWLEAERTRHQVGGSQVETEQEKQDAISRHKATAAVIGTRAMGTRFNVLMTIQVPLKQEKPPSMMPGGVFGAGGVPLGCSFSGGGFSGCAGTFGISNAPEEFKNSVSARATNPDMKTGTSNAARVSVGTQEDQWGGLVVKDPTRHPSQHITITVVMYNTVINGVPSEADVIKAIDDMEQLYKSCSITGHRADLPFAFANTTPSAACTWGSVMNPTIFPTSKISPSIPLTAVPLPPKATLEQQVFMVKGREPMRITSHIDALPLNDAGYFYMHDSVGLQWIKSPATGNSLVEAYHAFRLADDIYIKLYGFPSETAQYNLACCFCLIAQNNPCLVSLIIHELGLHDLGSPQACRDKALDLAIKWLRLSIIAGFPFTHAKDDCDLDLIRDQRPKEFQMLMEIGEAIAIRKGII